jgi:calnexin
MKLINQVGFELWTMQNNILFDNLYIGHSVEEAKALQKETWDVKIVGEKAEEKAAEPKFDDKTPEAEEVDFKKDPVKFVRQKVDAFILAVKKDPLEAVKTQPEVAGPIGLVILFAVALILTALSPAAPTKEQAKAAAKKTKEGAEKVKDEVAKATTTGAEQAKEATKRATRSSEKS